MAGAADSGREALLFRLLLEGCGPRAVPGCRVVYGMRAGRRPGGRVSLFCAVRRKNGVFPAASLFPSAVSVAELLAGDYRRGSSDKPLGATAEGKREAAGNTPFLRLTAQNRDTLPPGRRPALIPYTTRHPGTTRGAQAMEGLKAQRGVSKGNY